MLTPRAGACPERMNSTGMLIQIPRRLLKSSELFFLVVRAREVSMVEHSPLDLVHHASTWSIVWGVLLIVFGVLAIGSPFLAAVAVNAVIAWLIHFELRPARNG